MKNILFATTALVATAGIASADVTLSGSAQAGLASEAGSDFTMYSSIALDITMSGETDGGITFGATADIDAGEEYDPGDWEFDGDNGDNENELGLGSIFISGDFGTLTFDKDGIDDLYDSDADEGADLSYAYSAGDLSFGLTYNVDGEASDNDHAVDAVADAPTMSATIAYAMGAMSMSITGNDGDDDTSGTKLNLGYDVSEELSVGFEYNDVATADDAVMELSVAYSANGISLAVSADDSDDDIWDVSVGYAADGLSLAAATDESDEWEVTAGYDLGGGAAIEAGVNHEDDAYLGLALSF